MASGGLDATARVKLTAKQGYRTATAHLTKELSDRDRGLLIISVSGMRSWAAGLSGSSRGVRLPSTEEIYTHVPSHSLTI